MFANDHEPVIEDTYRNGFLGTAKSYGRFVDTLDASIF